MELNIVWDTFIKAIVFAAVGALGICIAIWRNRVDAETIVRTKAEADALAGAAAATAASEALRTAAQAARDAVGSADAGRVRDAGEILEPGDFRD